MATDAQDPTRVLEDAGQGHLVQHAERLGEGAEAFLQAAAALPWHELAEGYRGEGPKHSPALRPPVTLSLVRQSGEGPLRARVSKLGRGLLAGGRVATLLLAGGQGTRLGYDGPKGNVVFGPEDDRSLYRIHAERIAAVSRWAGKPVPFYVLTSPQTDEATREAFQDAEAWGLVPGQLRFLRQSTLPALGEDGQALLTGPGALAMSPDGHGGAYSTLVREGVIDQLAADGVDVLTTFQVDNPLGRPLDPLMLGWMVERRLEAIGKAVRKATPDEKVGVFARDLQGHHRVVEYTELEALETPEGDAGGAIEAPLVQGSIAIHGFAISFLKRLQDEGVYLPLHRAWKKVPHVGADGTLVEPEAPNAWKLERFIFDLFPLAKRAEVHEVKREWEFAPVKNAEGVDSLLTARVMVAAEVRRWHEEQGRPLDGEPSLRPHEIDGGKEYVGGALA